MSVQATFAATLVDEWQSRGVTDAVVCPGSRSTPMAVALARRLRTHVRLDERSAGFYAVGLAMSTGRPPILCVTSGTAVAELHPAVVEARYARVPLLVCTADRPPELHGIGAPQTIDQVGIFGTAPVWAVTPGVPVEGQEASWRPLAARAHAESLDGSHGPGPVHLNLAFREPLVGEPGLLPPATELRSASGRSPTAVGLAEPLDGRGLIVVGGLSPRPPTASLVTALAERLGWPVMADPRSGCRIPGTIAAADAIVRTGPPLPETVVTVGTPWLSKALGQYLSDAAEKGARVVAVDPWWQWTDPTRVTTEFHHSGADAWLSAAAASSPAGIDPEWLAAWRSREDAAQTAISAALGSDLSEPLVARTLYAAAAAQEAAIVVSASMPIRDLEWYGGANSSPPPVFANRGANGIDGIVSTALGVATVRATEGSGPTFALLGDLAFLHDVSGLVNLGDVPCTFVVLDNGGGGIFSFLPQHDTLDIDTFEQLFGTPPTSDVANVARGFGLVVREATSLSELETALAESGPALVRVKVPGRNDNVALHEAVNQAVRRALA